MASFKDGFTQAMERFSAFATLERIVAVLCMFIPLILYKVSGEADFRDSISSYVCMEKNRHIFGVLLTMAAMLFICNGAIYFNGLKREGLTQIFFDWTGKWYNIALGLCCLGVVVFSMYDFEFIHYVSATGFFVGSAFVMLFLSPKIPKALRILMAFLTLLFLVLSLVDEKIITLFFAEWISLIVIAIHYLFGIEGGENTA